VIDGAPQPAPARWVADPDALDEVVSAAGAAPRYALDTEFHRERSYYPKLALVQIAWEDQIALIDPLEVDPRLLVPLLEGSAVAVLHAAQQDLDVLTHACGAVPARLVDTQLIAGFVGFSTPSLASLVGAELGVRLPKADRLTDWLRRPLTRDQKTYAASDVAHLFELYDRLEAQLLTEGRLEWALDECEELRTRAVGPVAPDAAWLRLKDVRGLKRQARGVARAVAAWRERRAARTDTPVRSVLPDLAVLAIAQRAPRSAAELRSCRGVDDRHLRFADEILLAVAEGRDQPVDLPEREEDEVERTLRPAVTLVSAWVSQLARQQRLDTTLLATRADLVALLAGAPDARLASGWRAQVLGEDVKRLVAGEAALSFDGNGGLRLIDLSADRAG
jgi:ribonuclease D